MKKKDFEKIKDKSVKDLVKDIMTEKNEIAKLQLENKVAAQKDTNTIMKKRKRLAVMMTVINEKKLHGTV